MSSVCLSRVCYSTKEIERKKRKGEMERERERERGREREREREKFIVWQYFVTFSAINLYRQNMFYCNL